MHRLTPLALALGMLVSCSEAIPPTRCQCTPRKVGQSGSRIPWPEYNQGIHWHTSLEEAQRMAGEQKKLVFYFLVVGDLDKEGC